MARIKGRRPEDTRQALMAAAVAVFGELGYANATLAAIAQRAGVTAAVVPYHFKDKQGLWDAVLTAFYGDLMAFGRSVKLDQPLEVLLDGLYGWCEEHRDAIRVIIRNVLETGSLDSAVERRMGPALEFVSILAAQRFGSTRVQARDAAVALSHLVVRFVTNAPDDNRVAFGEESLATTRSRIVGLLVTIARATLGIPPEIQEDPQ